MKNPHKAQVIHNRCSKANGSLNRSGMDKTPSFEPQTLLKNGMGTRLHWFPADVTHTRLATILAAMANTEGGDVLLGISPRSAQVHGVKNVEEVMDTVFQAALLTDPPLLIPVPQVVSLENIPVVWVVVPRGLPHVYSLDGRFLGREGAQTNPLPARKLRQKLLERGVVQFEALSPPGSEMGDIDWEKAAIYASDLMLPGEPDIELLLLQRGCLLREKAGESQRLIPTYAGLLLFGKHPQQWLPNASILAARFSATSAGDYFIKQEIQGTLPEQINRAEAFIRSNLRSIVHLVGLQRQETLEYPVEAIREILVNAVAHRDYNVQGDNIHLYIFSDRIEIHSPGGLPGPVNLSNLLETRFSRNAVLCQVLSDMGYVERLGYGLNRVVEITRQNQMRSPRFEDVANSFHVTLYAHQEMPLDQAQEQTLQQYQEQLSNPRQEMALSFLFRHKRITNRDYQDLCPDVHSETLRRDLADLVSRGLLIKVGDNRATYYILKR